MACNHRNTIHIKNGEDRWGEPIFKCKTCGGTFKNPNANCRHPAKECVKNGHDSRQNERVKCTLCGKTFTKETKHKSVEIDVTRLILHLILAGCQEKEIAEKLNIPTRRVVRLKHSHLRECLKILPKEPLLSINTLVRIYEGIEKRRITKLNLADIPRAATRGSRERIKECYEKPRGR